MITKPKAKRFRIRRTAALTSTPARDSQTTPADFPAVAAEDDGFGPLPFPTARTQTTAVISGRHGAQSEDAAVEIEAIRDEGLSGRQLRTARRIAQRHGLTPVSDYDAVRQLRAAGIDPFQRANMLELVINDGVSTLPATTRPAGLPQTAPEPQLPSPDLISEQQRLEDVQRIQRDIGKRRRRRTMMLALRLSLFVLLPTFLAGYYYFKIATPFYTAESAFVINKAQNGEAGAITGLFSGTQFANSQDSITVQAYLQSRDAMEQLDKDTDFKQIFASDKVDPLQRLAPANSLEAAYKVYKRNVKVGYDPSEGIIHLDVSSPDPQQSVLFSKALISYAEKQVDDMTLRMRDDQIKGARESYDDAEKKLNEANAKVVDLQTKYKVLSSDVEVSLLTSKITALQAQLTTAQLDLQQMQNAAMPSQARIIPLKQRIEAIKQQIADARAKMTENDGNGESLARIQSQLTAAQADVQTRQLMLSQALLSLKAARISANQQTRYLSIGVQPIAPDTASYPKAFEDTLVAFLIFAGLYLMLSMTASILREQVSA